MRYYAEHIVAYTRVCPSINSPLYLPRQLYAEQVEFTPRKREKRERENRRVYFDVHAFYCMGYIVLLQRNVFSWFSSFRITLSTNVSDKIEIGDHNTHHAHTEKPKRKNLAKYVDVGGFGNT